MKIEKLTVTKTYLSDKKKDGTPLKTNDGKPYSKLAIKTKEYGDKYLSAFVWKTDDKIAQVKVGDEIMAKVEENGDFLNFSLASRFDQFEHQTNQRVWNLESDVRLLKKAVNDLSEGKKIYPQHVEAPNFDRNAPVSPKNAPTSDLDDSIDPDSIPF